MQSRPDLRKHNHDSSYAQINHKHDDPSPSGNRSVYTRPSRQIISGDGLTGGGDLTADRTLAVGAGTGLSVNADDVALSAGSIASLALADTAVQPARQILSGNGLTGGGDLSADLTLAVGAGTGILANADDVALDTAHSRNVDHSAVSVLAGVGLTGGGTLEADRTLAVGAGAGITVNVDDIAVNLTADFAWTGLHTFTQLVGFPNGSAASPSIALSGSTGLGIFRTGADIMGLAAGGEEVFRIRNDVVKGVQINGGLQMAAGIAPAQLTANVNNYDPAGLQTSGFVRVSSDASRNITGLVTASLLGRLLAIYNVGSFDVVLVNESASSTAAYRFAIGANIAIGPNEGVLLMYDGTSTRWRCLGKHV